ncbi:MFS transporter [Sphingobium lactosutens]|uniref:Major facilitator superfamily (MFS) profile domain-containing protein n=1 Tax=Sphingobium lactosutens DS20 TaxID=1331060 RepID=T0HH07_9SPHN|nr:MFS transporter [Sphingobium lactosutens]EQB11408.1 hypothetical protein RLDS_23685 [Sphingobium lactosutens DS20]
MSSEPSSSKFIVALAALCCLVDGYDLQSLGLAVPLMAQEHGVAPAQYGPALTATVIGMIIGALGLTPLGDRLGPQRMLIASMLLVSAGSLLTAVVESIPALTATRVLVGCGIGCAVPVSVSLVSNNVAPKHRTLIVTAVVVSTGLGSFLAGMAAPTIIGLGGWRSIFLVGAVMPALCALMLWLSLAAPKPSGAARSRSATPLSAVRALFDQDHRRTSLLLWLIMPANLIVTYALTAWLPTLLIGAGWESAQAQRVAGLLALAGIAGGIVLGALADRGLMKLAFVSAHFVAAAAFAWIGLGGSNHWLLAILVIGFTSYGGSLMLGSVTPQLYADASRSTGTGWASGIGRIGAVLGPLLVTLALNAHLHPSEILQLLLWPSLWCAGVALFLPNLAKRGEQAGYGSRP